MVHESNEVDQEVNVPCLLCVVANVGLGVGVGGWGVGGIFGMIFRGAN